MITRRSYQEKRFELLNSLVEVSHSVGLELGACDLPTVQTHQGSCRYGDFRSSDEMSTLWGIAPDDVCRVDYVISRERKLQDQIADRFDYVIACHVVEHVPNLIGYINDLGSLLKPSGGGVIFLAIPDKRATTDATRPSTTIERVLMQHYEDTRYPTLEHIMEFHCHSIAHDTGRTPPIEEAYRFAVENHQSGLADAHCNVWKDDEFHHQVQLLVEGNFLPGLAIAAFEPKPDLFNEFVIVLKASSRAPMEVGHEGRPLTPNGSFKERFSALLRSNKLGMRSTGRSRALSARA